MHNKAIQSVRQLGFTWETKDPFLFCVHHADAYPKGNKDAGPDTSLAGRNLGQDFEAKDGWRMYHGRTIPGFPMHPHRGFETVTVVLEGFVDHSDSHGASGRYGNGDVQWMTAGAGLQHAEMFPLLNTDQPNPLHLFQIWLNLPKSKKFAKPHYKMLWADMIPTIKVKDKSGNLAEITLIAGQIGDSKAPIPAPDSWAANPNSEVAIWIIKMAAGAKWTIPAAIQPVNRTLYFFAGSTIKIAGREVKNNMAVDLIGNEDIVVNNGNKDAQLVLLQGRPIDEPVVQYGPFVMNTQAEIREAYEDYYLNQFGDWPWDRSDPVHSQDKKRFAKYADGREEER